MGREDFAGGGKIGREVGMGREERDGEGILGWGGNIGMGREYCDGEGRLGWEGKIGMGGGERLGWEGKIGMVREDEMACSPRSLPFQGPKSLDFQDPPLPMPLGIDIACIPRHINNRYINSYYNCCRLYDVVVKIH